MQLDTGQQNRTDIGVWWHRVCTWHARVCQAIGAQNVSAASDRDLTSVYHWLHELPSSTLAATWSLSEVNITVGVTRQPRPSFWRLTNHYRGHTSATPILLTIDQSLQRSHVSHAHPAGQSTEALPRCRWLSEWFLNSTAAQVTAFSAIDGVFWI